MTSTRRAAGPGPGRGGPVADLDAAVLAQHPVEQDLAGVAGAPRRGHDPRQGAPLPAHPDELAAGHAQRLHVPGGQPGHGAPGVPAQAIGDLALEAMIGLHRAHSSEDVSSSAANGISSSSSPWPCRRGPRRRGRATTARGARAPGAASASRRAGPRRVPSPAPRASGPAPPAAPAPRRPPRGPPRAGRPPRRGPTSTVRERCAWGGRAGSERSERPGGACERRSRAAGPAQAGAHVHAPASARAARRPLLAELPLAQDLASFLELFELLDELSEPAEHAAEQVEGSTSSVVVSHGVIPPDGHR